MDTCIKKLLNVIQTIECIRVETREFVTKREQRFERRSRNGRFRNAAFAERAISVITSY
jgi:hypothetical protein